MNERRITWGAMRRGFLVVGVLAASASAYLSFSPDQLSAYLPAAIATAILALAFLGSDNLLNRIFRVFWRREWPK